MIGWSLFDALVIGIRECRSELEAALSKIGCRRSGWVDNATAQSSLQRSTHTRKKATNPCRICDLCVIRLGFEPKTHSLEGCCSIQLSYRT